MPHPEAPGGSGGESAPDPPSIKQTRLEARALTQRWDLPPSVRSQVLKRLASIVDPEAVHQGADKFGNPVEIVPGLREVTTAARALIAADLASERNRLLAEKLELDRERFAWQQERARPDDGAGDDFIIDLAPPDHPPHKGDGAPA